MPAGGRVVNQGIQHMRVKHFVPSSSSGGPSREQIDRVVEGIVETVHAALGQAAVRNEQGSLALELSTMGELIIGDSQIGVRFHYPGFLERVSMMIHEPRR